MKDILKFHYQNNLVRGLFYVIIMTVIVFLTYYERLHYLTN